MNNEKAEEINTVRFAVESLLQGGDVNLPDMLDWVADRFVHIHGENEDYDFILSLRKRANLAREIINKLEENVDEAN